MNKINKFTFIFIVIIIFTFIFPCYGDSVSNKYIFSDLEKHWARENIIRLIQMESIDGYPDGKFRPNKNITRAEFIALAFKTIKPESIETFKSDKHWATPYFEAALNNGVLIESEISRNTWNDPITRYEMSKIVVRLSEKIFKEDSISVEGIERKITDYKKIEKSNFSYYVKQAFAKGIIAGKNSEGFFLVKNMLQEHKQ